MGSNTQCIPLDAERVSDSYFVSVGSAMRISCVFNQAVELGRVFRDWLHTREA